jgi:glycosyltransferase involved in cell wall biosynthesis
MDYANWALARYLSRNCAVTIVSHRVWPDLQESKNVMVRLAPRPFRKHLFGEPFLDLYGRRTAGREKHSFVVVNGSNCLWHDVNWVHFVHAANQAYEVPDHSTLRRLKHHFHRNRSLSREKSILQHSRRVICNSHLSARHVVSLLGVHEERVRVVYYGTDPSRFTRISLTEREAARDELGWDAPSAVFVGALGDARKGFDTLYSAWKLATRQTDFDAKLYVVGRGASLEMWRSRASSDGLTERVHFLGFRDDVPRILAAADLMIHPARYEAYGLGVHEAICRGLPVFVSATAGVAERFPSDMNDMLIADVNDVSALADQLLQWNRKMDTTRSRFELLSDQLRQRSWDDMAAEFVAAVA